MQINRNYFLTSIAIALLLCTVQVMGNRMLILSCLAFFLVFVGWVCIHNSTLPMLLFFLPWSQLLRQSPDSFSFYTFGLVLICAISVIKKRFRFKRYHIAVGIVLLFLTLLSKLIEGNSLTFDYIAFIMLIFLFPVVKEEGASQKYDFFEIVIFFSMGIILAALCAQQFARYPNIAKYIRVDSYLTIVRMCGFYGDPNFYTAQITAALGGGLVIILREKNKKRVAFLAILMLLLVYCGFLSGSKSFVLIVACIFPVWFIELLRMRGRFGLRLALLLGSVLFAVFIATSAVFSGLLDVIITRFSFVNDLSDFTTGRIELWERYLNEILGNVKVLLIGNGFANIELDGRAPHNTIIEIVFQLGILGGGFLLTWMVYFFGDVFKAGRLARRGRLGSVILLIGVFLPWMAIDALYFDEFYLLQWYVFIGLGQLHGKGYRPEISQNNRISVRKRPTLRIAWNK